MPLSNPCHMAVTYVRTLRRTATQVSLSFTRWNLTFVEKVSRVTVPRNLICTLEAFVGCMSVEVPLRFGNRLLCTLLRLL